MKQLLFTIFILTLVSCGKLTGESTGANNIVSSDENLIGNLESVEIDQNLYRFAGTASGGGNSGHNFEIKINLAPGSHITFVFFANKELTNGYQMKLANEAGKIMATFSLNGKTHELELLPLEGSNIVHLDFDLHNDHSDIHALLWNHGGPYADGDDCTFEETCLYNSEDFALDYWLGVGRAPGIYWGFKGDKNIIIEVKGPRSALSNA